MKVKFTERIGNKEVQKEVTIHRITISNKIQLAYLSNYSNWLVLTPEQYTVTDPTIPDHWNMETFKNNHSTVTILESIYLPALAGQDLGDDIRLEKQYKEEINTYLEKIGLKEREYKLQKAAIEEFLNSKNIKIEDNIKFFEDIEFEEIQKDNTNLTLKIGKNPKLKIKGLRKNYIYKSLGAKLNKKIDSGFLIYIENGYLTKIKSYTYYEDWPEKIETIEFFEI